jgi:hypothetical protein
VERAEGAVELLLALIERLLRRRAIAPGEHRMGNVLAYGDDAGDLAVRCVDGAVAVVEEGVFEDAEAQDGNECSMLQEVFALVEDGFELGANDGPDVGPEGAARHAEGVGMAVRDDWREGVVVEQMHLLAPEQQDRIAGGEHHVDHGEERVRPCGDRTERVSGPAVIADAGGHLACAHDAGADRRA